MDKCPIQFDNGDLGCPDCKVPIIPSKVPISHNDILIGYFDGLKCPKCNFAILTQRGLDTSFDIQQSDVNDVISITKVGESVFQSHGTNYTNTVLPQIIEL